MLFNCPMLLDVDFFLMYYSFDNNCQMSVVPGAINFVWKHSIVIGLFL